MPPAFVVAAAGTHSFWACKWVDRCALYCPASVLNRCNVCANGLARMPSWHALVRANSTSTLHDLIILNRIIRLIRRVGEMLFPHSVILYSPVQKLVVIVNALLFENMCRVVTCHMHFTIVSSDMDANCFVRVSGHVLLGRARACDVQHGRRTKSIVCNH